MGAVSDVGVGLVQTAAGLVSLDVRSEEIDRPSQDRVVEDRARIVGQQPVGNVKESIRVHIRFAQELYATAVGYALAVDVPVRVGVRLDQQLDVGSRKRILEGRGVDGREPPRVAVLTAMGRHPEQYCVGGAVAQSRPKVAVGDAFVCRPTVDDVKSWRPEDCDLLLDRTERGKKAL